MLLFSLFHFFPFIFFFLGAFLQPGKKQAASLLRFLLFGKRNQKSNREWNQNRNGAFSASSPRGFFSVSGQEELVQISHQEDDDDQAGQKPEDVMLQEYGEFHSVSGIGF